MASKHINREQTLRYFVKWKKQRAEYCEQRGTYKGGAESVQPCDVNDRGTDGWVFWTAWYMHDLCLEWYKNYS